MNTTIMTRKLAPGRGRLRSRREEGGNVRDLTQANVRGAHISVMTKEVLEALALAPGDIVVDATFGQGGHSRALEASQKIRLISIDSDPAAAAQGAIESNFGDLGTVLKKLDIKKVDKVLFDLGWNTGQLVSGRGFSFLHDEPLVMSYGARPRSGFVAADILNKWSEHVLADIIFGYGEERYARRIAKRIVERRQEQSFKTSLELAEVVRDAVPPAYRRGRIHPATKTFQALRIAVNDELGALDSGLRAAWHSLSTGGRIAVITFHSIEDRAVKRFFVALTKKVEGRVLYKKPLTPSMAEVKSNPASRSAKLRAIEKI